MNVLGGGVALQEEEAMAATEDLAKACVQGSIREELARAGRREEVVEQRANVHLGAVVWPRHDEGVLKMLHSCLEREHRRERPLMLREVHSPLGVDNDLSFTH
jgi:hypothetical protein